MRKYNILFIKLEYYGLSIIHKMNIPSRIFAIIILIVLLPFLFLVSIISFFSQGLPIIFFQKRVGYKNKQFMIYKFRTMVDNHCSNDFSSFNDNRVTKWGRFLRYYKIDELPQLINIIFGDMVFIGPRPELNIYVSKYNEYFDYLDKIKPGITDLSSVLFRDEDKIVKEHFGKEGYSEILKIKSELTNHYIKKRKFTNDFKLIFFTIITIFLPGFGIKKLVLPTFLKPFPEKARIFQDIY